MTAEQHAAPPASESDVVGDHPRDNDAHVSFGAFSGSTLARVFVEDQVMNDIAKLQLAVGRPVRETLFCAPDNLGSTTSLRTEVPCHDALIERSRVQLWTSAALLPVQLQ